MKRLLAAAVMSALVLTSACTASASRHPRVETTSSAASPGAQRLAATLHGSLAKLTSTLITIDAGGLIATTTGRIKLDHGQASAADLTIGSGTDAMHIVIVGTAAYLQLAGQNSGKQWVTISATSSNEFARGLAATVPILEAAASLGDIADIVSSSTNFVDEGAAGDTTHYVFDVTGAANGNALQQQLADLGSKPVPVDLYLDSQGRPVRVSLGIAIGGSTLTINAQLRDFNQPVTITAPPANEVAGN